MPAFGGATISAALSLADRRDQIHHPHGQVAVLALEPDPCVGVARPEVVERDPVLRLFRLVAVDRLDLEQREVALPLLRRPHLSHDRVAGAEIEPLDLAGGDVDVVRAVEVVPVLAAQKAVALGQDLQDAFTADHGVGVEQ